MSIWGKAGAPPNQFSVCHGKPVENYDAAAIDGANKRQSFWYITLPLLKPTTIFIMVISIINSFQSFALQFVMTAGGPNDATAKIALLVYNYGFRYFKMGQAAAIRDADNWDRPLAELVADAAEAACDALQPARIGGGYGMLYGHSVNRRWIDRPVDPGVAVIRVDNAEGQPLGLITNFGCHAVVLGADNLLISADWPGYACAKLEETLGADTTCLFLQGGSGDVNPLVEGVRRHLRSGHTVVAIGEVSSYYGPPDDPEQWNIGNRKGGAFEEVAELGEAFAEEASHVARSIQTAVPSTPLWSEQMTVNAAAGPDEPQVELDALAQTLITERPTISDQREVPAEIMLLGAGDALLLGEPGEVFSQTAVTLKARLRVYGYGTPMLVGYANGWLAYLPEPEAFDEGGYEPGWARRLGLSQYFQPRMWQAVEPLLRQRAGALEVSNS